MITHNPDKWLIQTLENRHSIQNDLALSKQEIIDKIVIMGARIEQGSA